MISDRTEKAIILMMANTNSELMFRVAANESKEENRRTAQKLEYPSQPWIGILGCQKKLEFCKRI